MCLKNNAMRRIREAINTLITSFATQLRIVFGDKGIMLIACFLTFGYPILYSLIYNPELIRDVSTIVIDHDRTSMSRDAIRRLNATQELNVLGYAADLPEARKALNTHNAFCIIEIPNDFERKITLGEGSQIIVYSDMSLLLRYKSAMTAATNVAQAMGADIQSHSINSKIPSGETLVVEDPMGIHSVFMGDTTGGFASFIMPGVLILIIQQLMCLMAGISGGAFHEYPTLYLQNPLAHKQNYLAKLLGEISAFYIVALPISIWLLHYVPMIFQFPQVGNIWQEIAFVTPLILSSICLGMCLQAIVWQRESVFIIWVVTSLIFLFLSGLTWPRYAIPTIWYYAGNICPSTWGIEGFIRMNTNGATLWQVRDCYLNLWWLTAIYFVFAYTLQRFIVIPDRKFRYIIENANK